MDIHLIEHAHSVVAHVGNTPMVRLNRLTGGRFTLFAKLEMANPGGSVKDRTARAMIMDALSTGKLKKGMEILDATSGNTGIGYAWIGAALGIPVTLCVPGNASPERFAILKIHGANVITTNPMAATDGSQAKARELHRDNPGRYYYADQYSNDANWKIHMATTGPEIWSQTDGRITHFVSVIGTTGTMVGVSRFLKENAPHVKVIEVQPDSAFHGLEGIKHLPTVDVPRIYDPEAKTETIEVSTEDSQEMVRRLAREEGIFAGPSAGANIVAAMKLSERLGDTNAVIAIVLPDGGSRYLHDRFWNIS